MSLYLFERIDITGGGRGKVVKLIRNQWAQYAEQRYGVRLAGVWATIGSTGAWPEANLLWEMDDWQHFATASAAQYPMEDRDPYLNELWRMALAWRASGRTSLLIPSAFTPTLADIRQRADASQVLIYENVQTLPGKMDASHAALRSEYLPQAEAAGIRLMGAYRHAIRPNVGVNLWIHRDLDHWAELMETHYTEDGLRAWHGRCRDLLESSEGWTLAAPPERVLRT